MKKLLFALMCVASVTMFMACNNNNNPNNGGKMEGQWISTPDQIKDYAPNDTVSNCYQLDFWCDGTTIGRDYLWTTESAIILMINMSMQADYNVHGKYTKKYNYTKVEEHTEEACSSRQWEGAVCWLITYTFKPKDGEQYSSQEYFWAPEKNAKERWEYYQSHFEEMGGGICGYEYERANIDDMDACYAMNPEEDPVTPVDKEACWQVIEYLDEDNTQISYFWTTEAALKEHFADNTVNYTYSRASVKDEASCKLLADADLSGEEVCWKITTTINVAGVTSETIEYVWGPEEAAKLAAALVNESGVGTATYEKTSPDDQDTCESLNENE